MRLSRTDRLLLPLALLAGAGLVALAFHLAGFLGIACLGLAILFLAIHLEVEKAGAVGSPHATGLYAQQIAAQDRESRADKAARRAEIAGRVRLLAAAKLVGIGVIAVGVAGFVVGV